MDYVFKHKYMEATVIIKAESKTVAVIVLALIVLILPEKYSLGIS